MATEFTERSSQPSSSETVTLSAGFTDVISYSLESTEITGSMPSTICTECTNTLSSIWSMQSTMSAALETSYSIRETSDCTETLEPTPSTSIMIPTISTSISSSTINYPSSSSTEITTTTQAPNVTNENPSHDLSGDVGLIFGGILGSLSFITIVIIVILLLHKRVNNRRRSSYRPKTEGGTALSDKINSRKDKASQILGRRYEDIDLNESMRENSTPIDRTLIETCHENDYYTDPRVEAGDGIYNHLGTYSSGEPDRDNTYHHIDVNFQPCKSNTGFEKQMDTEHRKENYDHIQLATFKSGAHNPNYNHIEFYSDKCDSNYDHITSSQPVSSTHQNDNYHHIEL